MFRMNADVPENHQIFPPFQDVEVVRIEGEDRPADSFLAIKSCQDDPVG